MRDPQAGSAVVIVPLPGEIDCTNQERACDQLSAASASGAAIVIADFTATTFCDCSSLRAVVAAKDLLAAHGAQLRLVIPPGGAVRSLATLMGVDQAVPVYLSPSEAAAGRPARLRSAARRPCHTARRIAAMPDIIDVTGTDHLHISRWQARLGDRLFQSGDPPRLELLTAWDTLASLMDLHMRAEEEICGPAIYGASFPARSLARETRDCHEDIREIIQETYLQPPGSPLWWHLATTALAAWYRYRDREQHGPPGDYRRGADPDLRVELALQWRAFREARIRDESYPDAPVQSPTCHLRLARPAPPRLADPGFSPMDCTCPACTHLLGRAFGPYDGATRRGPGPQAAS